MATINLRPWREELRAEKQKQFVVMILGAAIIAGGLTFLWSSDLDSGVAYQQSRNAYIESATKNWMSRFVRLKASSASVMNCWLA